MKDLKSFILESGEFEALPREFKWRPNSTYFYFNPELEVYGFCTEDEIKSLANEDPDFGEDAEIILNMSVGEIHSPDGGINQYVRIKK